MKMTVMAFPLSLLVGLALHAGCGERPAIRSVTTRADTIPLDGRGGGVLAYTLQPGPDSGVHEIHVMNGDGTGSRRMIDASIGLNHHDWSPDGHRVVAVGYHGQTSSIYVFDADGRNLARLTNTPGVWDSEPTWSRDGSMIAFTRVYPAQHRRSEIWMMHPDGSDQRWIGAEGFAARWSPDGMRLIYQSILGELAGGQSDIRTCAVDGSDVQDLTQTPGNELTPVWSPDGSQIAFVADSDGDFDIFVMNADGTNQRRLSENDVGDFAPRWSPDGSRIAFSSDSSGNGDWEVYVVGADGANPRQVTHTPAPKTSINPVWRPNPRQP